MTPVIVQIVVPIVSLVITLLFAFLTKVATERLKTGAAKDAALELTSAASTVVKSIEQTVKPALVQATVDGNLSGADLASLKSLAMKELREQFSDQGQRVLKQGGARVEEALSRAIEAQVHSLKADVTTPRETTPDGR
jgi:hypothetical protein